MSVHMRLQKKRFNFVVCCNGVYTFDASFRYKRNLSFRQEDFCFCTWFYFADPMLFMFSRTVLVQKPARVNNEWRN